MRLMIIDDDAETGELLQRCFLLEIPDIKSTTVCPGFKAAKMVLSTYYDDDVIAFPDLVVLEAKLNGGSSATLVRLIRECKGMTTIPVLIYTNSDNDELKQECMASGATKMLQKGPKGPAELVACITTLMLKKK